MEYLVFVFYIVIFFELIFFRTAKSKDLSVLSYGISSVVNFAVGFFGLYCCGFTTLIPEDYFWSVEIASSIFGLLSCYCVCKLLTADNY